AGHKLGEMGCRIRAWSRHRIPRWAVAIRIKRRRTDRRNPHLSALDGDLGGWNPVGRAGARIVNVGDERRPELPHLGGKDLRIENIAVVIADIDDRWRKIREDAQRLKINFAVVAQAQGVT